jgi:UDP-GlcNAc:undecaprenyl-phosphate GlcNAc-1-phosphate transferase
VIAQLNYPQVWMLILAWFVADLATPLVIRLSHRLGALDRPQGHKIHTEPTPVLGGVAVYLAFAAALFSILRFPNYAEHTDIFAIVLGGFVVLVLGLVDSFRSVWAVAKLAVLFLVTLLLARFDVRINLTGLPAADLALTLLWISGVSSAMNSLDNMDGAATGVAGVAAFWTFYVAWYSEPYGQPRVSYVAIALLGACLGFLRYNFKPARIFLGDSGSLVLGFLLASLTVHAGWARDDKFKAVIVPCAILCVPLYDITLATVLRIRHGIVRGPIDAIVYCGRDHLSHRLVALGLSQREAVLLLCLFGMISGTIAVIVARPEVRPATYLPVTIVSLAVLVVLGCLLDRAKVYPHQKSPPAPAAAPEPGAVPTGEARP